MKELQDIIKQVKQVRLDALPLDILEQMSKEIEQKQHKLLNKALQIKNKIDGINIHQKFYGDTGMLPEEFTTPLKKILAQQREIVRIEKFNKRYEIELKRISNLINEKKMENRLISTFGSRLALKIKDIILMVLIFFVLSLLTIELSFKNLGDDVLLKIFVADFICCIIFLINFF